MNKVRDIQGCPVAAPAEEAAYWFGRARATMSAADRAEFAQWKEASDANRTAYEDVERAWDFLGKMGSDPDILAMRGDSLWMKPRRRYAVSDWRVAAALLLCATAAFGTYVMGPGAKPSQTRLAAADSILLQTAVGERSTATLRDGSVITLNTNSKVRVTYGEDRRSITLLTGQAFFKVAKDKTRPFVVTADGNQVVAVGTQFDVSLQSEGVRVALLEGRVDVRPAASPGALRGPLAPSILHPGQMLFADKANGRVTVRSSDVGRLLSWRQGRVRFEETSLADAVADMNRYTKTPIRIADPGIADLKISGAFRVGESSSFVASITAVFPVRAVKTASGVELYSAR